MSEKIERDCREKKVKKRKKKVSQNLDVITLQGRRLFLLLSLYNKKCYLIIFWFTFDYIFMFLNYVAVSVVMKKILIVVYVTIFWLN